MHTLSSASFVAMESSTMSAPGVIIAVLSFALGHCAQLKMRQILRRCHRVLIHLQAPFRVMVGGGLGEVRGGGGSNVMGSRWKEMLLPLWRHMFHAATEHGGSIAPEQ
jgi:hypothetical protein